MTRGCGHTAVLDAFSYDSRAADVADAAFDLEDVRERTAARFVKRLSG